jgi:putative spermidine/putrescine transport system substrate-binding protein
VVAVARRWVGAAAALALLATTAACSGGSATTHPADGTRHHGRLLPQGGNGVLELTTILHGERALNLIARPGLVQPQLVAPFQRQTGCVVKVSSARTAGQAESLLETGGFDGLAATGEITNELISAKQVAPLDLRLIPDYGQITGRLQNAPDTTENGVHYGVPYLWAADLLLYDTGIVKPAPTSWAAVFDGAGYPGRETAYSSPMSIADAALYLKSHQPSLGISNPYELTAAQFTAAVATLRRQHAQVGGYWSSTSGAVGAFTDGTAVIGTGWPAALVGLRLAHEPVAAVVPAEGTAGWNTSWMMYAHAAHPYCMLRWLRYVATPIVQGEAAYAAGAAPANPQACAYLGLRRANYCQQLHVADGAYLDHTSVWQTPMAACGNGKRNCVPYVRWVAAWASITGG